MQPKLRQWITSPYLWLSLALFCSTWIKLTHLGSRELWLDETYSAYVASTTFKTLLVNTLGDLHPPLFHMLLWVWVRVVGNSESQLRLFSVLLNALAIGGLFWSACQIVEKEYAAYPAFLFAFAPMLFIYGMEVRSYILFLLLLNVLLGLHWLVHMKGAKHYVIPYSLVAAALFYVHYLAVFLLLGLLLHALITNTRSHRSPQSLVITSLLVITLSLPGCCILLKQHTNHQQADQRQALANANPQAISHNGMGHDPGADQKTVTFVTRVLPVTLGVLPLTSHVLFALCVLPLLVGLVLIAFLLFSADPVCLFAVTIAAALLAGAIVLHLFSTRYVLSLIPLYALSCTRVIQWLCEREKLQYSGMALSCLIAVVYVAGFLRQNAKLHGSPWKDVVHALQENARPGDELIFSAPYAQVPFDYFWRDRKPHLQEVGFPVSIYAYWNSQKEVKGWGSPIVTDPELASFVERTVQDGRSRAVWLLSYESYYYDPESRLPEDLKKRGTLTEILLPENPDDTSENAAPRHLYRFVPTSPSVEVTDGR